MQTINVTQYKWAGSWGPFKIKIPCGECGASEGIIEQVIKTEFAPKGIKVNFEVLPWLDNWWKPLLKGAWHAPIVEVNGKVIGQGKVIDAGRLGAEIRAAITDGYELRPEEPNVIFSKPGCPHCKKAKEIFAEKGIAYIEKDITADPFYANQLFYLTKQFFPHNKPVTVPQIWLEGSYFGEASDVEEQQDSLLTKHTTAIVQEAAKNMPVAGTAAVS
ncbi:MAG: glutaredoxin [Patescibacteria group bacterium]